MNHIKEKIAITATPEAIAHLKKQLQKQGGSSIRLDLVKSGCSGYRYKVTCIDEQHPIENNDKTFQLDETIRLYVSKKIFPSVMGTVISYQKKGLGGELAFDNPQQTGACGCGESVAIHQNKNQEDENE